MKKYAFLSVLLMFVSISSVSALARKKRPDPNPPSTIEIITKVNDYWQSNHSPNVRSFWDEAAYHTGNMEAYRLLGKARWLAYSDEWARHNKWMGAQEKDASKWKYKNYGEGQDYVLFGDWQICFQTYLDMYAMNPDPYKIARAIEVMDYEVRSPETDFWWWADALYMVMPVFTKMYKTTGEVKYLDKLYANYKWADDLMYDKEEQLYYRDAKYIYPKVKTASGGKSFWARGDGWVLAGLAKVLTDMPEDYVHRDFFVQRFRELAEGVARVQRPSGYWSRSMLCEEDAPGPETSGTAFFTYGMLWGVNHGLLDRDTFVPVIDKAWKYLTTVALQVDGSVGFVQPIGEKPDPTKTVDAHSQSNFGVGAFLLAACEHLRYEDSSVNGSSPAITVAVTNESNEFRQQVIELDAGEVSARLGIQGGRQFIVYDPAGLELPYQLTYDEKVLIDAGVSPNATLTLTLKKGTPQVFKTVCYGRIYPERKDDYAWENDRGAYRVYGPALQKTGEKSYGTDVWSKNTPELVVEQRYWTEDVVMMPTVEKLRRENRQKGDSLYRTISYHHDHGRGMDLYKVGATLGCGTPALMNDDDLVYPYCFKNYEVLDNGPLRTTVLLNYEKKAFNGDSITEHRLVSLDKGSNFNRCTVWYTGMTKPARLASGVVIHSEDKESYALEKDYVAYADPTDNPRVNNCQLFVATLYPQGDVQTKMLPLDQPRNGNEGHALGIVNGYKGERFTYYFGSAWSKYDIRTMAEWQQRIDWTLRSLRQPLKVNIH
ncbi:MAG: DUF4861 family protein [Prevotella sp.]|nr:DUF4861 family protein [Prevotella sp.]